MGEFLPFRADRSISEPDSALLFLHQYLVIQYTFIYSSAECTATMYGYNPKCFHVEKRSLLQYVWILDTSMSLALVPKFDAEP